MFDSLETTEELKYVFSYSLRIPNIAYNTNELIYINYIKFFKK